MSVSAEDVDNMLIEACNRLEKASETWDTEDEKSLVTEYDRQIETYDQDCLLVEWKGPLYTAEAVKKHVPDRDAHLLDVCGGTGAVGKLLREKGYGNVDYLDGSLEMTRVALKNGYYQTYICHFIPEHKSTVIQSDIYDGTMISGGHITEGKILEMLRITKPGGLFVAAIVETTEVDKKEAKKVLDFLDSLCQQQRCRTVEKMMVDKMILRKTNTPAPGHVIVLQRIL